MTEPEARSWGFRFRECLGGGVGAVVMVGTVLTLGLLGYAPLGPAAAETGIPAAFVATAIGGLVVALRARSVMPAAALSSATALIVASLVGELASDAAVRLSQPGGIALVVCAVSLCVIGMGLLQIAFSVLRLGGLVKFVPQPVLAGFMTGVAILIVLAQVPPLLGIAPGVWRSGSALGMLIQPATLLVGLASAAIVWLTAWRFPRAPAALLGLLAGALIDALLRHGAPDIAIGAQAGMIPSRLPLPLALAPLFDAESADILFRYLPKLLATSLVLAILGSLESVLGAKATDQQTNSQHDANGDLLAFGFANVASGIFAGLPVVYTRTRAAAIMQAGGRTWRAAAIGAIASGLLFIAASPVLSLLPLAVLAGMMLTNAVALVDRWTRRLLRQLLFGNRTREAWTSIAITGLVCGTTLWLGFVAGVAAGVLVSMLVFIHAMNRALVRARHTAVAQPSRRVYPRALEETLAPLRARITIFNLEGALFFGNVDRLQGECAALPDVTRYLVLDLSRVTTIDATGALALGQLAERLSPRSITLLLAGVSTGNRHGRLLLALGGTAAAAARWFPDTDQGVEAAEHGLLAIAGADESMAPVAFEDCSLVAGLSPAQIELVRQHVSERALGPGETLFREGDAGNGLFVLTRGSVSVLYAGDGMNAMRQRFVSFSPGMMFGEVALLDRVGRTADAVADVESTVLELTREALEALRGIDAALCASLYANIALHLAERLRTAAVAWSASVR